MRCADLYEVAERTDRCGGVRCSGRLVTCAIRFVSLQKYPHTSASGGLWRVSRAGTEGNITKKEIRCRRGSVLEQIKRALQVTSLRARSCDAKP